MNKKGIITDQDRTQAERDELITDYQRIVDAAESGEAKVEPGMLKFAQGRLIELRRASTGATGD